MGWKKGGIIDLGVLGDWKMVMRGVDRLIDGRLGDGSWGKLFEWVIFEEGLF